MSLKLYLATILILAPLLIENIHGQVNPECFAKGECTDSLVLDYLHEIDDANACLESCQSNSQCEYFTFFESDSSCLNLANCINYSTDSCTDCYSGDRNCEDLQCWIQGQCNGVLLSVSDDVTENDCLDECRTNDNCFWFTHDSDSGLCELLEDCQSLDTSCDTCISSQVQCSEYNTNEAEKDLTKLIVVGGFNIDLGGDIRKVEVIDLKNPSSDCDFIADYPADESGMAVGLFDGAIKSCGSLDDTSECYDYDLNTNSWTNSASMLNERAYPRASFIDGIWLVSGDESFDIDDVPFSSEIWTGSGFEQGPTLPIEMFAHCQLTVNSSHIFFANTAGTGYAYLFDWYEQSWTVLPQLTPVRSYTSCGLINNPENGPEVVVLVGGVSEIFNFNTLTWRVGPKLPSLDNAGFAQLGDTFVIVGGDDYATSDALDTIYQFDHLNYEWILLEQRLKIGREFYPGVVAVPDDFVSCT